MMLFLPRREILRQVRANLGMQTTNDLGSQVEEQHVVAVNSAALKVQQECGWVNTLKRATITLNIEQDHFNYPEDCRPGSVRGMAVYADEQYYQLEPRVIPVQADSDQELAVGGETLKRLLARPRFYQERDQIYVWPRVDKAYPIRVEYMQRVDLFEDSTVSIVDALLIIYQATIQLAVILGDEKIASWYSKQYAERMIALRGWQSAGTRFAMDSQADFGEGEFDNNTVFPNWYRGLSANGFNNGPTA